MRIGMNALMGVGTAQVLLGIGTLIYVVPMHMAATHQGGSLTLLSTAIWMMHLLRRVPK